MTINMDIFGLKYTVDLETNMKDELPTIKNIKNVIFQCYSTMVIAFFPQKLVWVAAILDFSTTAARGGAQAGSRKIMNAYDDIYHWYKFGNFRTK